MTFGILMLGMARSLEYDFSDVDMSELFSARKRKALNVRGSHSVDGGPK